MARHLAEVLKAWNRQQVWKILTAIGPLREGDELILLSQTLPDLSRLKPRDAA